MATPSLWATPTMVCHYGGNVSIQDKTRQDNERSRTQALQCLQVRISNVNTQTNNNHFSQVKTLIDLQFRLGSLSNQT